MKFCVLLIAILVFRQVELNKHRHHHDKEHEDLLNTVGPKQGTYKNELVAEYGTNFRYLGKVKNGLDRVTVVTSLPTPRYEKLQVQPTDFGKCAELLKDVHDNETTVNKRSTSNALFNSLTMKPKAWMATRQWCVKVLPYTEYLQQQEKYYIERVHNLLCDDLYAALPELRPLVAYKETSTSRIKKAWEQLSCQLCQA